MSSRLDELNEVVRVAREEAWALEEKERKQKMKDAVGKFFKYSNAGGSSGGRWWLYAKVVRQGKKIMWLEFQTQPNGDTDFTIKEYWNRLEGFQEITRKEFLAAWKQSTSIWKKMADQF